MGRFIKRTLIIFLFLLAILSAGYFFWVSPQYVTPILMYHRFGYNESSLFVTPENFEKQMAYLKDRGYQVLSLDKLGEAIRNKKKLTRKTIVITIDDGYADNYIYAYPVLKKYGFSATIFLAAEFIDNDKDFLTWEQIKTMSEDKISFGGHTRNQVYLPDIDNEDILRDEIAGCKNLLEYKIGKTVDSFCYPTGGFNEKIKDIVKKSGYKLACTTNRGFSKLNEDLYELKRVKITNSDMNKPLSFRMKVSGYYNLFRGKKRGY